MISLNIYKIGIGRLIQNDSMTSLTRTSPWVRDTMHKALMRMPPVSKYRIVTAFRHYLLKACELINLTSLIGSVYVKVSERGEHSIFASCEIYPDIFWGNRFFLSYNGVQVQSKMFIILSANCGSCVRNETETKQRQKLFLCTANVF